MGDGASRRRFINYLLKKNAELLVENKALRKTIEKMNKRIKRLEKQVEDLRAMLTICMREHEKEPTENENDVSLPSLGEPSIVEFLRENCLLDLAKKYLAEGDTEIFEYVNEDAIYAIHMYRDAIMRAEPVECKERKKAVYIL